jgi:hypothetical protein
LNYSPVRLTAPGQHNKPFSGPRLLRR